VRRRIYLLIDVTFYRYYGQTRPRANLHVNKAPRRDMFPHQKENGGGIPQDPWRVLAPPRRRRGLLQGRAGAPFGGPPRPQQTEGGPAQSTEAQGNRGGRRLLSQWKTTTETSHGRRSFSSSPTRNSPLTIPPPSRPKNKKTREKNATRRKIRPLLPEEHRRRPRSRPRPRSTSSSNSRGVATSHSRRLVMNTKAATKKTTTMTKKTKWNRCVFAATIPTTATAEEAIVTVRRKRRPRKSAPCSHASARTT